VFENRVLKRIFEPKRKRWEAGKDCITCTLTEHHIMKAYWGSGGIAPPVL
jgi:hypothetical protein